MASGNYMDLIIRKYVGERVGEKLKQVSAGNTGGILDTITQFLLHKPQELLYRLEYPFKAVLHFPVHIFNKALTAIEYPFQVALHFMAENFNKALATLKRRGPDAFAWLSKAFWVALPYMIGILVVVLLVYFWRICWVLCFGCVRMMKAPGMACIMIPRALFEASPRIYFIVQRSLMALVRSVAALVRGFARLLGF